MNGENSFLVRYSMTTIPPGCDPYPAGVEWAQPDLDHAAELMRHVVEHREQAEAVGERARKDLLASHSLDSAAVFIKERLAAIPDDRRRLLEVEEPIRRAAVHLRGLPGDRLAEPSAGVSGIVRRGLRKLLWPELAAQRKLDERVVESLEALLRELDSTRRG
jgi:hypothetical protein